jgi:hypothetical protein
VGRIYLRPFNYKTFITRKKIKLEVTMRKVSLLILVVFMLANVFASKIGIGLSTTWNDNEVYIPGFSTIWNGAAIYIPINVNPQFRIEPFVMVATDASEETDPDNPEWSYNNEILNYRIGLGLFIKVKVFIKMETVWAGGMKKFLPLNFQVSVLHQL